MGHGQLNEFFHIVGIGGVHFNVVVQHEQVLQQRLRHLAVDALFFLVNLQKEKK